MTIPIITIIIIIIIIITITTTSSSTTTTGLADTQGSFYLNDIIDDFKSTDSDSETSESIDFEEVDE